MKRRKLGLLPADLTAVVNKLFSRTLWHPTSRMRLVQFLFHTYGVDKVAAEIKVKKGCGASVERVQAILP